MSLRTFSIAIAALLMTSLFSLSAFAEPQQAELRIAAPAGTRVLIDGRRLGVTPLQPILLDAGRHRVILRLRSGHVGRTWMDLAAGSTSRAVVRTRDTHPQRPMSGQAGHY